MPKTRSARATKARADPVAVPPDGNAPKQQTRSSKRLSTETRKSNSGKKSQKPAKRADSANPPAQPDDSASATDENTRPKPSKGDSYLLSVRLAGTFNPNINRLLCVPSTLSFAKFHEVLQIAFGWTNSHMHAFSVSKIHEKSEGRRMFCGDQVLQLLPGSELKFKTQYSEPEQIKSEEDFTLGDVYDGEPYKGKVTVSYEYDHGDGWNHLVWFLGRAEPGMKETLGVPEYMDIFCITGEGHPCAEDCGGTGGWEDLKETFKKRKDPEGVKEWYKNECFNADPKGLDPYKWDMLDLNDGFVQMKA